MTALSLAAFLSGTALLAVTAFADIGSSRRPVPIRNGGKFRIAATASNGLSVDPAMPSTQLAGIVEATCARLMSYPDARPPEGLRLRPEVAKSYPLVSRDGKTLTFVLRPNFRFSNGEPVRASAFEHQIVRLLELKTYGAQLVQEIVGADRVQNGHVEGIDARRGNRLVIKLVRRVPDFSARLAAPWFCAVPPDLPADPEGETAFPAAGPYYVAPESVRGRRLVLKRNKYYRGFRPHHVGTFVVDGQAASLDDVLDRVEQGTADWGWATVGAYLDPERRLVARLGVNKRRFFLEPGLNFLHYALNTARPLFRNNARLRRAVNFAINRKAIRAAGTGRYSSRLTDQYLPPELPGFVDAHIYPLKRANLREALRLARGHTRRANPVLYTPQTPALAAVAQVIKQELARIGLHVDVKTFPFGEYVDRIHNQTEPWDIAWSLWGPDYLDPATYLNSLLDGQFVATNNWAHFNSRKYNVLLRRADLLRGNARYRTYGKLDVDLARDAAPIVAISYLNQPTLVSSRVDPRCVILRPELDLTAVCLK